MSCKLTRKMQTLFNNLFNSIKFVEIMHMPFYKNIHACLIKKHVKVSKNKFFHNLCIFFLLFTCHLLFVTAVHAEVLERIVAIVNDNVILLSEYEETFKALRKTDEKITEEKALDEMINRVLILEQARKLRLGSLSDSAETLSDDKIITEYIERRIKSFIYIPIEEIESYYMDNRERFVGKAFYDVKDEMEDYLTRAVLTRKIAEHIEELRKKAYIRVQKAPAKF